MLSGGAIVVNLWHGVPMKCIEFGITQGELAKRYVKRELWDVFFHPASFRRPDYFASTTDFFDEVFSKSFRIKKSQCLHVGCARNQLTFILNKFWGTTMQQNVCESIVNQLHLAE